MIRGCLPPSLLRKGVALSLLGPDFFFELRVVVVVAVVLLWKMASALPIEASVCFKLFSFN
jgi:hypothetical protein